jgi:hypothetical protein
MICSRSLGRFAQAESDQGVRWMPDTDRAAFATVQKILLEMQDEPIEEGTLFAQALATKSTTGFA